MTDQKSAKSRKPHVSRNQVSRSGALTPKQEKFCLLYVELGNASEAYRQAYEAWKMSAGAVNTEAKRLLKNPPIALRVRGLFQHHYKRHEVSVDKLTAEMYENRELARLNDNHAVMQVASRDIARMRGYMTLKHEHELNMTEKVMRHFFKLKDTTGLPAQHLPKEQLNHPDIQRPDGEPGPLDDDYAEKRDAKKSQKN